MNSFEWLEHELKKFAGRYYLNIFWQRLAIFISLVFIVIVSFSWAEYSFWFDTGIRMFLFWSFVGVSAALFAFFLAQPLFLLTGIRRQLSKHDFALVIGKHFPEINDRILNVLELNEGHVHASDSDLLAASIHQKLQQIKPFRFLDAIDHRRTRRMLPFLILPVFALLVMGFTAPELLLKPFERISNYNTFYERPAPFVFVIQNSSLNASQNSDVTIGVKLVGNDIPEEVFMSEGDKSVRMVEGENGVYQHVFRAVKDDIRFRFQADGFFSDSYLLDVYKMPAIVSYTIQLDYPAYTGKPGETLNNINSVNVPRGTNVRFLVLTRDADELHVVNDQQSLKVSRDERYFSFSLVAGENERLVAISRRKNIVAADSLEFNLSVIPDDYPSISVEEEIDSTMFMVRYFKGRISDDYGLSKLQFSFTYYHENHSIDSVFSIPINQEFNLQEFYNAFDFSRFNLLPGDKIDYFFTVYDNDAYAGFKSARSQVFTFRMPTDEELKNMIDEKSDAITSGLESMYKETEEMQKELEKLMNDLAGKKKLTWEEQERLKELLYKEKTLEENLNKMSEQNAEKLRLNEQLNQLNQDIFEKQQQIDELMNQIMDEEFRDLLEKLRELMEKNQSVTPELEKLNLKNEEILKSMEQTIEVLKRTAVEEKISNLAQELKDKSLEQKELTGKEIEKSEEINKQEELNREFEELKQLADSLLKKNEALEEPFNLDSLIKALEKIDSTLKSGLEQLKNGKENKADKSQQDASDQMQELAEQLESMMQEAEMEQQGEDINLLREILENLIALSFSQEDLMRKVAKTRVADPAYYENLRMQKRIDDGLAVIDDSLSALGRRNPMINSYISDELLKIKQSRQKAINNLNNRYIAPATKEQQSIMMGINNLALMLSEVLRQMQEQANQQMQSQQSGNSQCKKPGNKPGGKPGKGSKPSAKTLRQLQEQLNQQMEGLKKQMESGQQPGEGQPGFSEQLAKMAAQQEAIRKAMQEYQQQLNSEGAGQGQQLNKVINDMEKTEEDLVNKRLTQETMNRQKQIETRLLESEKAEMEREKDPKRQSEEAKVFNNGNPMTFFKYNSLKRNSSEILKTVPPNLNPYYRQKVNDYLYKLK